MAILFGLLDPTKVQIQPFGFRRSLFAYEVRFVTFNLGSKIIFYSVPIELVSLTILYHSISKIDDLIFFA